MPAASEPASSRAIRIGKIVARTLLIVLGTVLGLVVIALAVLDMFGERWLNRYAQRSAAELERQLQRPIRIGKIELSALRGSVEVAEVLLGAGRDEPKDAPALTLSNALVDVGLWRTLLSLGMRPYVEEVRLRGLRINVVKLPDGSFNWDHLSTSEPTEEEPPRSTEPDRRMRNAKVGLLALHDASLRLVDAATKTNEARISHIDLELRDAGYSAGGRISVRAAVLQPERNLNLTGEVSGLTNESFPPIERLALSLKPTNIAPLAPFLSALGAGAAPRGGVLRMNVDVKQERGEEILVKGVIALARAVFPEGAPFDAQTRFDLTFDRKQGSFLLREGVLEAGSMALLAQASLENLNRAPKLRSVHVESQNLSFGALRSLYPRLDELTAPARLEGGFALRAQGGGDTRSQTAEIELSLTPASLTISDDLHKPQDTPLVLKAKLRTGENAVAFAPLTLQLADYTLHAQGKLANLDEDEPSIDVQVDTPNPRVGGMLRMLPPVARAARSDAALPGNLTIHAKLKGTTARYKADANLALSGLDVNVPGARLQGSGKAALALHDQGQERKGTLRVDFTPLTALYTDLMQKPAGTPLRIDVDFEQGRNRGQVKFSTMLASLVMQGTAKLRGEPPQQNFTTDVKIPSFAVRKVMRLVPGFDPVSIGDIHFSGEVHAEGVTGKPETLKLDVPSFAANAGRSELQGSLQLANAESPRVNLKARSNYLDLAEFVPPARGDAKEAPKTEEASLVARTHGQIDVQVKRGRAADVAFENLSADLRLSDGRARAERLEVSAFGGQFSGTGSEFPLSPGRGDYWLKGSVQNAQIEGVLQRFAGVDKLLRGALSAKLDLKARDLTPQALSQTLTGVLQGSLAEGAFLPANGYASLTNQLGGVTKLPPLQEALSKAQERLGLQADQAWELREMVGALRFERGSAVLSKPLTANTPQGTLSLEGKLGLSNSGDLRGTFTLTPEALTALTAGQVKFEKPLPLPFRVEGPITRPVLKFGELDRVLEPLLRSYAEQQAKDQLRRGAEAVMEQTGLAEETKRALEEKRLRKQAEEAAKRQIRKRLPF